MKLSAPVMTVEKTSTGFSAYCEEMGAYTTGTTFEELQRNALTVLNMALPEGEPAILAEAVRYAYDVPAFFAAFKVVSGAAFAKRVGMTQSMLSQYTSGTKKAGAKQRERLTAGIRALGQELAGVELV